MREGKNFGPDRMVTFDVIIAPKAESDKTVREVFFVVELSSKPKSFGVSRNETFLHDFKTLKIIEYHTNMK